FNPVLVQAVNGFTFQNVQTVFHHVRFSEGDHATGFKVHDVHVHVVTQVGHVGETGGAPTAFGVRHDARFHVFFVGHKGFWCIQAFHALVALADPVEVGQLARAVVQGPVGG